MSNIGKSGIPEFYSGSIKANKEPIKPVYAIVEYWALSKAFQRFIFRNPFFEDEIFGTLPQYDRNQIVKEALEIQGEK